MLQNYSPTSFFRYQCSEVVGARVVRFVIWDTSGTAETSTVRSLAYREADVFLLCYSVSDPGSLFTAINHWVPDLRLQAPATPIVLVGCQSDRRTGGGAAVTSSQALAVSQQIGGRGGALAGRLQIIYSCVCRSRDVRGDLGPGVQAGRGQRHGGGRPHRAGPPAPRPAPAP